MSSTPEPDQNTAMDTDNGTVSSANSLRPKRRTNKVDYAEKKEEEYEDHIPRTTDHQESPTKLNALSNTNQNNSTTTPTTTGKRKYTKRSTTNQSTNNTNSRSESPNDQDGDTTSNGFPLNYEPSTGIVFSNILDLDGAVVKDKLELKLKNGQRIKKNDNIYLICEPPGEPYYIGRIMGFVKKSSKRNETEEVQQQQEPAATPADEISKRNTKPLIESAEDYMFKINWWYRCRDISKKSTDTRLLYASMHSDTCPLQSYRGACTVKHREEIDDLDAYRTVPNHFWFDKLFDRYMIKFYDVVPTALLTYLPPNYRKALEKRFQYIFIEQGRSKDMLQSPKSCIKCNQWCTSNDSIECCECHNFYHRLCLDPPLLKKPARGFAWSCIKCTRKLENNTIHAQLNNQQKPDVQISSHDEEPTKVLAYEQAAITFLEKDKHLSFEQRRNEEEWTYRYLGMHSKLEDALDVQDRPYPRAVSRLGNKHQLTGIVDWFDHKVEYYDQSELEKKYQKPHTNPAGRKKKIDGRKKRNIMNEVVEEVDTIYLKLPEKYKEKNPDTFPLWLQERPKGYIQRGGDSTVELMWKQPQEGPEMDKKIQNYVDNVCAPIAKSLNIIPTSPNFVDALLKNLLKCDYDFDKAMELNNKLTRESLREPTFTEAEVKKFEAGIKKYGSELFPTFKEVKTQPMSMIVRFYYLWKKTKNGHLIWDNFEGRKKNHAKAFKEQQEKENNNSNNVDDSSYDGDKIKDILKLCKHCKSENTKRWFRAPGQQHPDGRPDILYALCDRCARLWRRYAVLWEDFNEVFKKTGQKGGNGWKKRVEYELVADAELIWGIKERLAMEGGNIANLPLSNTSTNNTKRKLSDLVGTTTPVPEEKKVRKSLGSVGEESNQKNKEKKLAKALEKEKEKEEKKERREKEKEEKKERERLEKENANENFKNPERPPTLISNVLQGTYNTDLSQATLERYYQISSSAYNSRLKFKENKENKVPLISHDSRIFQYRESDKSCGLCLETATSKCLHCSSCGINVHRNCYGINQDVLSSERSLYDYTWYCDPCSNTLNPVVSTTYKCCICEGDHHSIRSPMKRTSSGSWVHIVCALLTESSYFANIQTLQPVHVQETVAHILRQNKPASTKCSFCSAEVLLRDIIGSGYSKTGYSAGFKLAKDNKTDPSKVVKISVSDGVNEATITGTIEPAVCCPNHSKEDLVTTFFPFSQQSTRSRSSAETLLSLYLEDHKKPPQDYNTITGCKRKFHEQLQAFDILTLTNDDSHVIKRPKQGGHFDSDSCSLCSSKITLKWFWEDNSNICYACHTKKKRSSEAEETGNGLKEDILTVDNIVDKLKAVYETELSGTFYGIRDFNDRVLKPDQQEQTYKVSSIPPLYSFSHPEALDKEPVKTHVTLSPDVMSDLIKKYSKNDTPPRPQLPGANITARATSKRPTPGITKPGVKLPQIAIKSAIDSALNSALNKEFISLPGELYTPSTPILNYNRLNQSGDKDAQSDDSTEPVTQAEKHESDKHKMSIGNILG